MTAELWNTILVFVGGMMTLEKVNIIKYTPGT